MGEYQKGNHDFRLSPYEQFTEKDIKKRPSISKRPKTTKLLKQLMKKDKDK